MERVKIKLGLLSKCIKCMKDKKKQDKKDEEDEEDKEEEKNYSDFRCLGYMPIIMKSVHYSGSRLRDQLINIAMFCKEFETSTMILDNKDLDKLFKRYSTAV